MMSEASALHCGNGTISDGGWRAVLLKGTGARGRISLSQTHAWALPLNRRHVIPVARRASPAPSLPVRNQKSPAIGPFAVLAIQPKPSIRSGCGSPATERVYHFGSTVRFYDRFSYQSQPATPESGPTTIQSNCARRQKASIFQSSREYRVS